MEQGTTTFWEAAKELGPVVVLLLGIGGLGFWQLIRLYVLSQDKLDASYNARVADAMAGQQAVRDNTSALQALNATTQTTSQAQSAAMERMSAKLDQLVLEVTRLKGG